MCFQSLVLQLAVIWLATARAQYCNISPQHTLCKYSGLGSGCGTPRSLGLNTNERGLIVAQHNKLRAELALGRETRGPTGPQPPAANMKQMEWDDELAAVAQRWAEQCSFGHDANRDVGRFMVGQNVYEASATQSQATEGTVRQAIASWYDEVKLFNSRDVNSYHFDPSVGHYTQMMWASTDRIGCGHVTYTSAPWIKTFIVCNYGPSGNFIGSPIYATGKACSGCPRGTSCSSAYPGLCAPAKGQNTTISIPTAPTGIPGPGAINAVDVAALPDDPVVPVDSGFARPVFAPVPSNRPVQRPTFFFPNMFTNFMGFRPMRFPAFFGG